MRAEVRERARAIAKMQQRALAEELSRMTSEEYQEDIMDHMELMADGGALPKLAQPVRLGAGAPIGSGQQYISWIHLDDLCQLFITALTDESWRGVYNAVAPTPVTNETMTRTIAQVLHRPMLLPNIPAFAIKLAFGEMGIVVTGGNYVLNKRIADETPFQYQYADLTNALENLLK